MNTINVLITKHGKNHYSLSMEASEVSISATSHAYDHRPGNHSYLTFQGITLGDMEELALAILIAKRKESGEKLDTTGV